MGAQAPPPAQPRWKRPFLQSVQLVPVRLWLVHAHICPQDNPASSRRWARRCFPVSCLSIQRRADLLTSDPTDHLGLRFPPTLPRPRPDGPPPGVGGLINPPCGSKVPAFPLGGAAVGCKPQTQLGFQLRCIKPSDPLCTYCLFIYLFHLYLFRQGQRRTRELSFPMMP